MPCLYEVAASGMRGMGWSVLPTIVVIVGSCLLRIVYVFTLFPLIRSFENLMLIYPVTWIVTGATMIALLLLCQGKNPTVGNDCRACFPCSSIGAVRLS